MYLGPLWTVRGTPGAVVPRRPRVSSRSKTKTVHPPLAHRPPPARRRPKRARNAGGERQSSTHGASPRIALSDSGVPRTRPPHYRVRAPPWKHIITLTEAATERGREAPPSFSFWTRALCPGGYPARLSTKGGRRRNRHLRKPPSVVRGTTGQGITGGNGIFTFGEG